MTTYTAAETKAASRRAIAEGLLPRVIDLGGNRWAIRGKRYSIRLNTFGELSCDCPAVGCCKHVAAVWGWRVNRGLLPGPRATRHAARQDATAAPRPSGGGMRRNLMDESEAADFAAIYG